nr:Gfo/Idh/MocA family oxidoreductase [Propionicimonas sp.]
MRIGLVGYGGGGRWFHAPYIDGADGVELVGVVTRSPERIAELHAERPGMPVYASLTDLLAAGVDAVAITTPPQTRRELVLEAIAAGVHVVADKPFAPSAAAAAELGEAADAAGVRLSVYHQRRRDADIQTLKHVLDGGELGRIQRFSSIFDLDEPGTLEAGPHGGLLRDLGSHLVDQALWLFGPVRWVSAHLEWVDLPEGRTDAGFALRLDHASGTASFLSASKLNRVVRRVLELYGADGAYLATGSDVQTGAIKAGLRPRDHRATWGYEPEQHWGRLYTAAGERVVPSVQGNHADYYTAFARAVADGSEVPVPVADAVQVLAVLDAARASAEEHRTVEL